MTFVGDEFLVIKIFTTNISCEKLLLKFFFSIQPWIISIDRLKKIIRFVIWISNPVNAFEKIQTFQNVTFESSFYLPIIFRSTMKFIARVQRSQESRNPNTFFHDSTLRNVVPNRSDNPQQTIIYHQLWKNLSSHKADIIPNNNNNLSRKIKVPTYLKKKKYVVYFSNLWSVWKKIF